MDWIDSMAVLATPRIPTLRTPYNSANFPNSSNPPTRRTEPAMTPAAIRYSIRPSNPEAHLFEVRCTLPDPDPAGQRFALPAWIPGSYLIRDFARHVMAIRAEAGGQAVALDKINNHTWQAAPLATGGTLSVILSLIHI